MGSATPQNVISLRRALQAEPHRPDLRLALAWAYHLQGRHDEASNAVEGLSTNTTGLDEAARIRWAWIAACADNPTGSLRALMGLAEEPALALDLARRSGFGGHWRAAEGLYARAATLQPGYLEAHHGQAVALDYLDDFEASLAVTRAACGLFRDHPGPLGILRFHLGQVLLLLGRMPEGFAALEARFEDPAGPSLSVRPEPAWDGSPLHGRPLLLRWDQGYGDAFMMVRFAARLARRGGPVFLECPEEARAVLETAGIQAIPGDGRHPCPEGTVQAPLNSLPHLMGIGLEEVAESGPYLHVPPDVPNRQTLDRLLGQGSGRRLGLVWAGNPAHGRTGERDLPMELLPRLNGIPDITWFSLQKGAALPPELDGVDLAPSLGTFSDTAHALSRLDGLVTVDTSVAHLAGALGCPTWLLLPRLPDWRWLLDRGDSPWYSSLRLLRQPFHGDWLSVLEGLCGELTRR